MERKRTSEAAGAVRRCQAPPFVLGVVVGKLSGKARWAAGTCAGTGAGAGVGVEGYMRHSGERRVGHGRHGANGSAAVVLS